MEKVGYVHMVWPTLGSRTAKEQNRKRWINYGTKRKGRVDPVQNDEPEAA